MYQSTTLRKIADQRVLHEASLELTYRCNLDCFYCYNDREKAGQPLSLAQYETLLQDLARMQTLFLMLTGGEPMVHPHFFAIGALARDLGFVTRVRTNGHTLNAKNCKRLHSEVEPYIVEVSIHGACADSHDKQTRVAGSHKRLLENLHHVKDQGLRCGLVCTPTAWNEDEIDPLFDLADKLELPLRFQGPVAPRDNGDTSPMVIQPAAQTWTHITRRLDQRRLDPSAKLIASDCSAAETAKGEIALCGVGTTGVDIDPFGNVQACMHLQTAAGSLHQQSIADIWQHSPLFQQARQRAVDAAGQFTQDNPNQFGAPVYCIAVEENAAKNSCQSCSTNCH